MSRTCGGVGSVTQGTWNGAAITCECKLIIHFLVRYLSISIHEFNFWIVTCSTVYVDSYRHINPR